MRDLSFFGGKQWARVWDGSVVWRASGGMDFVWDFLVARGSSLGNDGPEHEVL